MSSSRKDQPVRATEQPDANRDPISGEPGAHPVGVGVGAAAAGAATGALGGAVAGPVGSAIGAVVGAVAGGLGGKAVAENIDPTTEDTYWRDNYASRPYVREGARFEDYQPAYRYGYEHRSRYAGRSFDEAENDLRSGWEKTKDKAGMAWDDARDAVRDAWDRVGTSSDDVPVSRSDTGAARRR